jgi:hypothetical protein
MTAPWVRVCAECGREYTVNGGNGDILLPWCYDCRKKPAKADPFVKKGNLYVPNPTQE